MTRRSKLDIYVFEGVDGTGKSTASHELITELTSKKELVLYFNMNQFHDRSMKAIIDICRDFNMLAYKQNVSGNIIFDRSWLGQFVYDNSGSDRQMKEENILDLHRYLLRFANIQYTLCQATPRTYKALCEREKGTDHPIDEELLFKEDRKFRQLFNKMREWGIQYDTKIWKQWL